MSASPGGSCCATTAATAAAGGCDHAGALTVVLGDVSFRAERRQLIASCDYFAALFRSGMRESRQREIHLRCPGARGFLLAMAAQRGDTPPLDADDIVAAVECAAFLQAAPLARLLVDALDSDNCLLMLHAAAAFGLTALRRAAAAFLRDAYDDLRQEAAAALAPELLAEVEALAPRVFAAVGAHVACGAAADSVHADGRTVCYLDERNDTWKVLTDLPLDASTSMAGVTVLDNRLYVIGGVRGVLKEASDACFCYSVDTDAWTRIPGPAQRRYNLGLVGAAGRLYALGGEYERAAMSSVEIYDAAARRWRSGAHLPRPAAGAACAAARGRVFVCLWRPTETSEILEYEAAPERWRPVTALLRRQSYGHCLVAHRDNLYLMRNGPSDDFLRCLMDCYSLSAGQWTALPGHFANSRGSLFTAAVRGDSALTLQRSAANEFCIRDRNWKPRRRWKGFPRSGSVKTFMLRLPPPPPDTPTLDTPTRDTPTLDTPTQDV